MEVWERILRLGTKTKSIKAKFDQSDLIKVKNICSTKARRGQNDNLHIGRKYLQAIYPTELWCVEYIKNSQSSMVTDISLKRI